MNDTDHPSFDPTQIPFSRKGSWLDISPVVGLHRTVPDLHLVSHVTTMTAVLSLVPVRDGRRVECTTAGSPARLRWFTSEGTVEAVFEGLSTVRLRGRGTAMAISAAEGLLTPFTGPYLALDPVDGSAVFTLYETGRRYRVTTVSGGVTLTGAGIVGETDRVVLVEPGADGWWEVAIEEFETARPPYRPAASFDAVAHEVGREFETFLDAVAPWRTPDVPATALAAYVVWSATAGAGGFLTRDGVLMSKHWMDSVWSWDHCFNALATAALPGMAWDQLQVPFDHQDPTGALPDSVTHSRVLYNYVKPPIHGWMYGELLAHGLPEPDRAELARWYDRLVAWTRFWLDHRRAPGHALPYYQHGNDSGWDNSTSFDASRVIEAPDLAAFLALQAEALAHLAERIGRPAEVAQWEALARDLVEAMLTELWNGEQFVVRDVLTGTPHASRSLLGVLPLVLGRRLPDEVRTRLATIAAGHLTDRGLATEPVDSPHYDDDGYWRGPIWAPSTFVVENGLRNAGFADLADVVNDRFRALCEQSGFAENFDARTGAGLRDRAYTWTASVYLVFARAAVRRAGGAGSTAVTGVPGVASGEVEDVLIGADAR